MAQGKKTGGRKKGTPNKATELLARQAHPLVKKADARIQQILDGKLPCMVCHGKGKTKHISRHAARTNTSCVHAKAATGMG